MEHKLILRREEDTVSLARAMRSNLARGDTLLLHGPVGVGKSAFARALIQSQMALDDTVEDVPSPTFTLVQLYDTSLGPIFHADLYRLSDRSELEELGFPDAFDEGICLVEWPDRLADLTPMRRLDIYFEFDDSTEVRKVTLLPFGARWDWIDQIAKSV